MGLTILPASHGAAATPAQAAWKQNSKGRWWTENSAKGYATGWRKIDGKWYWFDARGYMVTGWKQVDGKWYYFNPGGSMKTGWLKDGGKWYYLNPGGSMATGWKKVDFDWYYFESSGAMAKDRWQGDYYLSSKGRMLLNGWTKDGYYVDDSGKWDRSISRMSDRGWQRFVGKVRCMSGTELLNYGNNTQFKKVLGSTEANNYYAILEMDSSQKIWYSGVDGSSYMWSSYIGLGKRTSYQDTMSGRGPSWVYFDGMTVMVWGYPWLGDDVSIPRAPRIWSTTYGFYPAMVWGEYDLP